MTVQPEDRPLTRREIRERERREAGAAPAGAEPTTPRRVPTGSAAAGGASSDLGAGEAERAASVQPTPAGEPELRTAALDVIVTDAATGRQLTRRELRALLAQQQAEQDAAAPDITSEVGPAERPTTEGDEQNVSVASAEEQRQSASPEPPQEDSGSPVVTDDDESASSAPETGSSETGSADPASPEEEAEQPQLNTALFATVGGSLDIVDDKATEITGSFHPPIEHQAITEELDSKSKEEVDASFDSLIASGVAATGAATTTNALILPTSGETTPVGTDTGEVLVTGTFELPRSLGSTGQHPNLYDSPDVDRYVDRIDREQPAADSEPVRASSAVSTHVAGTAMIAPQKKRGVSAPVVLAITAAVLLVASIALFIGGFVLNIF